MKKVLGSFCDLIGAKFTFCISKNDRTSFSPFVPVSSANFSITESTPRYKISKNVEDLEVLQKAAEIWSGTTENMENRQLCAEYLCGFKILTGIMLMMFLPPLLALSEASKVYRFFQITEELWNISHTKSCKRSPCRYLGSLERRTTDSAKEIKTQRIRNTIETILTEFFYRIICS